MGESVYVLGDVHGNFRALKKVFSDSSYVSGDPVIFLGDLVDGPVSSGIRESVAFLACMPNVVAIRGNHDEWFWEWLESEGESQGYVWLSQGGNETIFSYGSYDRVPLSHVLFFKRQVPFVVRKGVLFVHGGLPYADARAEDVSKHDLMWDRSITSWARRERASRYKHVYVGHTTTELVDNETRPVTFGNVTFLDTGAGWRGVLTLALVDIDTGLIVDYWCG